MERDVTVLQHGDLLLAFLGHAGKWPVAGVGNSAAGCVLPVKMLVNLAAAATPVLEVRACGFALVGG